MRKKFTTYSYGAHPRQKLDFYIPSSPQPQSHLFIILHGGAWITGSKSTIQTLAQYLAKHGHYVANINYRLLQQVDSMENQIKDISSAFHYLNQHFKNKYSYVKTFAIGESAGAHLCLLSYSKIKWEGIISISGPTLLNNPPLQKLPFKAEKWFYPYLLKNKDKDKEISWSEISPFYTPIHCPILFFQGKKDRLVSYKETIIFANKLKQKGQNIRLILIPKWGHLYRVLHRRSQKFIYKRILLWVDQINQE